MLNRLTFLKALPAAVAGMFIGRTASTESPLEPFVRHEYQSNCTAGYRWSQWCSKPKDDWPTQGFRITVRPDNFDFWLYQYGTGFSYSGKASSLAEAKAKAEKIARFLEELE